MISPINTVGIYRINCSRTLVFNRAEIRVSTRRIHKSLSLRCPVMKGQNPSKTGSGLLDSPGQGRALRLPPGPVSGTNGLYVGDLPPLPFILLILTSADNE